MFTKETILAAQARVKSGADYPHLVQELKGMGIRSYVHFVAEGSNVYQGEGGHSVTIGHAPEPIPVADQPSAAAFRHSLTLHQQGKTDYPTFCRQAGEAGVDKWTSDLAAMTGTFSVSGTVYSSIWAFPTGGWSRWRFSSSHRPKSSAFSMRDLRHGA